MATARVRLITGAAGVVLLAGLVGYTYADAQGDRFAIGFLGLIAVSAFAYGLVARTDAAVGGALAAAAVAYLVYLHANHKTLPLSTAVYAGCLLAVAELAHRSVADGTIAVPVVSFRRWTAGVAALAVTTSVGAAAIIEVLRAVHGRSPWLEPLGFVAILAAILVFQNWKTDVVGPPR